MPSTPNAAAVDEPQPPPARTLNREVIDISDSHASSASRAREIWDGLQQNKYVRLVGPCQSTCKLLLKQIPRNMICATPEASVGFHAGDVHADQEFMTEGYPPDIQEWVTAEDLKAEGAKWLRPPELFYYFRTCSSVAWEAADPVQ